MAQKNRDQRCQALTKSGKPCGAAPMEGGLCFLHANPNKARELGRIGGRKKRASVYANPESLAPLDNAVAVRDALARWIPDLIAGKLSPKIATPLASLLNLQLRAIEATEVPNLREQIAEAKQCLAEIEGRLTVDALMPDSEPAPHGDGPNGHGSLQPANPGREEIRGTRSLPAKATKAY